MKIIIQQTELNDAIQNVSKALSSRTTIPILGGIKIEVTRMGVALTASDTDITIQSYIPCQIEDKTIVDVEREGSVVLPAKFFVDIIRKLSSSQVEIETGDHFQTMIRAASTDIQLVGLDPEEFPLLPKIEENQTLTLMGDVLKNLIRQTVFAVSTNETTPILTGVLWELSEGRLKLTATDRHRLATSMAEVSTEPGQQFGNVVISGKTLNELNKIIPDQNMAVDVVLADNQVLFRMDRVLFFSRILDGIYPDTSKIIPQHYKTELILHTEAFTDAIERTYLLSREEKSNIAHLVTKENGMVEIMSSSSELGKVTERLEAEHLSGDLVRIAFNSKYMLDVLKVMNTERLHIGFTGAMSPIILKPADEESCLHLILPYRTSGVS